MKALVTLLLFSVAALAAGPEPDPWWMNVDKTQSLLVSWITAIGVVLTALIAMVAGVFMFLKSKLNDLKERQDRQSAEKQKLTEQVIDLAKQVPPPSSPITVTQTSNPENKPTS